ncbi:glycosyltransferase family 2 protein [Gramella sp. KN1008]|uniref:glycosyltransferase family 2 protein n=1 Tax=Gramella sp. KN1008 TaxID=2529298 RepID=UPI00103ED47D|nr:glycosyltransferase family 2 protein [Gramella sp. KN1008]TBW25569.1 glycosyltransferase family 2 protein [Gramella sp. KN1008]
MNNLVSIIIPTYNRTHLIGETLESVLAQSFKEWECIVVDDGSNDYIEELMDFYCEKDDRIFFYRRQGHRRKGANSCRNYGFELSKGEYIQWFDSDDLMVPDFLASKIRALHQTNYDFVISKSINFRDPNPGKIISRNENYYRFHKYSVTNLNYIEQKINWLTYDFMGKRKILQGIKFNEKLSSGQEYNFFCKLTSYNVNGKILDSFLTLRRIHPNSIQSKLRDDEQLLAQNQLNLQFYTWKDLREIGNTKGERICLYKGVAITLDRKCSWKKVLSYTRWFHKTGKNTLAMCYLMYQLFFQIFNKGNIFRRKFISLYNSYSDLYGQY